MDLTYILLAFTTVAALFIKNTKFLWICLALTCLVGLFHGVISFGGIGWLIILTVASCFCFKYKPNPNYKSHFKLSATVLDQSNIVWKIGKFSIITALLAAFLFHLLPGFSNKLVFNKIVLSPLSCPYSMHLNFSLVMTGLIIYITSGLHVLQQPIDKRSLKITFICLVSCTMVILAPAYLSGYILFAPKIPNILWIWALNNFLFVCMYEEVIFRGYFQGIMLKLITNSPNLRIALSSIVFGLGHFKSGGIIYVILATICGVFYGYVYEKTNKIICSMMVHFGLNLVHFTIFTYPAAINIGN
jgi:membrane protease YdiL (CAAX protease family)